MKERASWLLQHVFNLLTALLLALLLWVAVQVQTDPNITQTYPRRIPITVVGLASDLLLVQGPTEPLSIMLRAPESVWQRLTSQDRIKAIVDLSGFGPGTYRVPVALIIEEHPVEVVEYSPKEVEVRLEALAEKDAFVTVELIGEPAVGFQADTPRVYPSKVHLEGPKSLIDQVAQVQARVLIQDRREPVDEQVKPIPLTQDGRPISGLTLNPEEVRVVVPIRQLGGYRDVSVRVILQGRPAPGYNITNISVYPPVVTLFSQDPTKVLEIPGFVETEPLNIEGIQQNQEVRVGLQVPEGIQVVGDPSVLVQIAVSPIPSSVTVRLPVEVVGLAPGLQAIVAPNEVDIVVLGPLPVLRTLKLESLRAYVNVEGLEPGVYTLKVETESLIREVQVTSVVPEQVEVTLQQVATPTSIP